ECGKAAGPGYLDRRDEQLAFEGRKAAQGPCEGEVCHDRPPFPEQEPVTSRFASRSLARSANQRGHVCAFGANLTDSTLALNWKQEWGTAAVVTMRRWTSRSP